MPTMPKRRAYAGPAISYGFCPFFGVIYAGASMLLLLFRRQFCAADRRRTARMASTRNALRLRRGRGRRPDQRRAVDPELGVNIVDFRFVCGVSVEDGAAWIVMTAAVSSDGVRRNVLGYRKLVLRTLVLPSA